MLTPIVKFPHAYSHINICPMLTPMVKFIVVKLAASRETAKIVKLEASIEQQNFSSEYKVAADSNPRDRQHQILLFKVRLGFKNATLLIAPRDVESIYFTNTPTLRIANITFYYLIYHF